MFWIIIKDFFTLIFILLLGFLGGFSLYIDKDVNDMSIRLDDIKQTVENINQQSLDEFEGKLNIIIADKVDDHLVYISCPFSYMRPGLLAWRYDEDEFGLFIDEGWFIDIYDSNVKYKDLLKLKAGEIFNIHTHNNDSVEVFLWRSKKTLTMDLLD